MAWEDKKNRDRDKGEGKKHTIRNVHKKRTAKDRQTERSKTR